MKPVEVIKVDIKKLKKIYPREEWPCLKYCNELLATNHKKDSRLEVWNYDRDPPEADWIVTNIGEYSENAPIVRKRGQRYYPPFVIE